MFQKLLVVMFVTLLSGYVIAQDQGPSSEQVLGAIAGGALGSTIGKGDGKKAATVIGAIIGYRNGDRFLNPNQDQHFDPQVYSAYPDREGRKWFERRRRAEWECRHEVPSIYYGDVQLTEAWIKGCIERKLRITAQLERDAYLSGREGY
jgi:hypothetical protein